MVKGELKNRKFRKWCIGSGLPKGLASRHSSRTAICRHCRQIIDVLPTGLLKRHKEV